MMCPKFNEMDVILSGKRSVNLPPIFDTLDEVIIEESAVDGEFIEQDFLNEEHLTLDDAYDEPAAANTSNNSRPQSPAQDNLLPKSKRQRTAQSSAPVNALIEMQEKRLETENYRTDKQMEIEREKMTIEREKLAIEKNKEDLLLSIEQRKIEIEEKKLDHEMTVRRMEIQLNADIARAKIESEERIRRYEIELTTKNRE